MTLDGPRTRFQGPGIEVEYLKNGAFEPHTHTHCLFVCLFVCLYVCKQDYAKAILNRLLENWWNGDTWAKEEILDFGDNPDYVTLGLGL